jgi:hypothetical protein
MLLCPTARGFIDPRVERRAGLQRLDTVVIVNLVPLRIEEPIHGHATDDPGSTPDHDTD